MIAAVSASALIAYLLAWGHRYGLDLRVYRDSVSFWWSGRDPYRADFTSSRLPFTYPPFALLFLTPLTWASFLVTQCLLWVASVTAATVSVLAILRDPAAASRSRLLCEALAWSCAAALVLEPARSAMDYGQVEFILMFVVVADLLLVPPSCRGIGVGLAAAVKLTPLAFIVVLAVGRDVRSVLRAAASFLVWTGLSWVFWPRLSVTYWLHDAGNPARVGPISYAGNQCWYAILHRPPFPAGGSGLAWLLLSLLTLTAGTFVAWRCVSAGQRAAAVVAMALASLLISPISWSHHWVWVLLVPVLLARPRGGGLPRPVQVMLWGLTALAVAAPYWWFSHGIPADVFEALMPVWAAAVLAVWSAAACTTWRREKRTTTTPPAPLAA